MDHKDDNKRIAKNTIFLYLRMIAILAISFYSTRILLGNLGITDFGIFNVVAGVIVMLDCFTSSMTSSIQRFITYEIGKSEIGDVDKVFGTSLVIQLIFSVCLILLGETLGVWFLDTQMNIPEMQKNAAFWVFQASLLTTIITMLSTPYMSLIIAHEKMGVFAYFSIIEASLKLLIVFLIAWMPFNRLICYAFLVVTAQLIIRILYSLYCKRKFKHLSLGWKWDSELVKTMLKFAGWTTFGGGASILFGQGINILLNIFFGPVVNAARGIAVQVQSAMAKFCTSFQTAINPQITKSVAVEDKSYLEKLICYSSKFSFYLLFIVSVPLLLETNFLLKLWLKEVPEYTVEFLQIITIILLFNAISNPLTTTAMATGEIKRYQQTVGGLLLLIVPVSYVWLKMGGEPIVVFLIHLVIEIIAYILRLCFIRNMVGLSIHYYLKHVWSPIVPVVIMTLLPMYGVKLLSDNSIFLIIVSFFWTLVTVFVFGLRTAEKKFLLSKLFKVKNLKFSL